MIEHIDKLIRAGVDSFKIEGRVKSEYYVAAVVKAYREAIDRCMENPDAFRADPEWLEELEKVSHRGYTTGFYLDRPSETEQNYKSSSYIREYDLVGIVKAYDERSGIADVLQKNRFFRGETIEFVRPVGRFFEQRIDYLTDDSGIDIDVANKPQSIVKIKTREPLEEGSMLRRRISK